MTIYPRGNMFYCEFTVDGRRIKRSTRVNISEGIQKAQEVALRLKKDVLQEHKENLKNKNRMKFSEGIQRVYNTRWKHNKDPQNPLRRAEMLLEITGDIWLDELDSATVRYLQETLFSRGITPATVNRYMSALRVIVNSAVYEWEVMSRVPKIPRFVEEEGRIRYLSDQEEEQLLAYLRGRGEHIYADFFACLLDTGFRFSELNDVYFDDIKFSQRQIHCWRNKGNNPRTVPMTSRVYNILKRRREQTDSDKPFGLNYWATHRAFNRAKKAMGLVDDEDFCIHALRHTCASRLVQRGVSLYAVQKILGHSSIQVTERYAHLNTDVLHQAIKTLET